MDFYLDKKEKITVVVTLFACILVPIIVLGTVGYLLGLQTPVEQLGGDLRIEEVAQIKAISFGGGGCLVGIVAAIAYGIYVFSKIESFGNR